MGEELLLGGVSFRQNSKMRLLTMLSQPCECTKNNSTLSGWILTK